MCWRYASETNEDDNYAGAQHRGDAACSCRFTKANALRYWPLREGGSGNVQRGSVAHIEVVSRLTSYLLRFDARPCLNQLHRSRLAGNTLRTQGVAIVHAGKRYVVDIVVSYA